MKQPNKTLIPFNIVLAKAPGAKIVTRNGRSVRLFADDIKPRGEHDTAAKSLAGAIDYISYDEICTWDSEGHFIDSDKPHEYDLFIEAEREIRYGAVFRLKEPKYDEEYRLLSGIFDSPEKVMDKIKVLKNLNDCDFVGMAEIIINKIDKEENS